MNLNVDGHAFNGLKIFRQADFVSGHIDRKDAALPYVLELSELPEPVDFLGMIVY